MEATFLGGIKLVNNINVFAYKNDVQYWLSLYKDDKFVDFVAYGPEISGLTVSCDGIWFAYFQKNPQNEKLQFSVWKYNKLSEKEHEIVPYCEIHIPLNDFQYFQACFSSNGTHVACLGEWNHVYIIDLQRIDVPTEFYIPNGGEIDSPQMLYDVGTHFIWFGQDEFARIIDLTTTTKRPMMWRYKMKNTKYLFVINNHVVHMTEEGIVGIYVANLREKRFEICHNIKYPTGEYNDISIEEDGRIKLHKNGGEYYYIDL